MKCAGWVACGRESVHNGAVEAEWTEVGQWTTLSAADEHALVVLAMRTDCRVAAREEGFALEVEGERVEVVRAELEEYAREQQQGAVQVAAVRPAAGFGWFAAILWAAVLVAMHHARGGAAAWVDRWSNDARAVWVDGEYWRAFTALFLHGDLGHVAGNVLIGGAFCVMVAAVLGALRGWTLIFLSGALGNLLGGWLHWRFDEGAFRSIGASTATFGALGLLVGVAVVRAWRDRSYGRLKRLVVPVGAGVALFGMFGVGGVDTDVVGHLAGWVCGVSLGAAVAACEGAEPVVEG